MMSIRSYIDVISRKAAVTNITPPEVANQPREDATRALEQLETMPSPGSDKELRLTLGDLRAMAYLGYYYADKIMGGDRACGI
jgi:hypothetical protein